MWTDAQFDELEQEETNSSIKRLFLMYLVLRDCKSNIEKEFINFYRRYGKNEVVTFNDARKKISKVDHRKRVVVLFGLLQSNFDNSFTKLENKFQSLLTKVVDKEVGFFGVKADSKNVLSNKWGEDNTTWNKRLWNYNSKWKTTLQTDFKRSLIRQDNLESVLQNLDKRFISMEKILKRLVLSESTAIGSLARKEIFKELGISKYKFYSRDDERTCEICGSLHGLIFPITSYEIGINASPIHPRCRCWEVPILETKG